MLHSDGTVHTFKRGVHTDIAGRRARGLDVEIRKNVVNLLTSGLTPLEVNNNLADMDPAARPLLSQIQSLNKRVKGNVPNMDTIHDAMIALQPSLCTTQAQWESGSATVVKVLGILSTVRIVDGVEVPDFFIVFTCRAVAGNLLPAMSAWGRIPLRTDGTFRLTRMYVMSVGNIFATPLIHPPLF